MKLKIRFNSDSVWIFAAGDGNDMHVVRWILKSEYHSIEYLLQYSTSNLYRSGMAKYTGEMKNETDY